MGITLISALMIQNNETCVDTYSNQERTGYGFVAYLMKEGEIHTEIVSTLPNTPYKSEGEAKRVGDDLVRQVRETDLKAHVSGLQKKLGEEDSKTVSEVIHAAKK